MWSRKSLGRRFGWLWAAYAVSAFGTSLAFDAFSLIAIRVLHAGPGEVSGLAAAGLAVGALVAVPLGPWVEFRRKRPVMVTMDLLRFVMLLSVPAAYAFGRLGFAQLLVVSVIVGAADITFTAASGAYLKTLVRQEDLLPANGRFEATTWTTTMLGPPLGGVAIGLLGPAVTVIANATSFLLSATGIHAISGREPFPAPTGEREPSRALTGGCERSPALAAQHEPSPALTAQRKPSRTPTGDREPNPAPASERKPSPAPTSGCQPRPAPTAQHEPSPALIGGSQPSPALTTQRKPSRTPIGGREPNPAPTSERKPSRALTSGRQPSPALTAQREASPAPTAGCEPSPALTAQQEANPAPTGGPKPRAALAGGPETGAVPTVRRQVRLAGLVEGWRYILVHRGLRPLFFNVILVNGLNMAAQPLMALLMLGQLGFTPWQYGLAFAAPCVGGLVGSRMAGRLVGRFGTRRIMRAFGALRACWQIGLVFVHPGAGGLVLVMAVELGVITCFGVFNPVLATYRLSQVPADRVARALSAWSVASKASIAALTFLCGLLAGLIGPRPAIAVAGLVMLVTPFLLPRNERTEHQEREPARSPA